jgi:hypothetical protein
MVKAKFSSKYFAMIKRLQRLPKFVGDMAETVTRKDAEGLVEEYKKGIRDNTFNLEPLKPNTIKAKKRQGYSRPYTPLYGKGNNVKNSLINIFKIKKIPKGYKVYMSRAKHHKAGISLRWLFRIHEEGAIIKNGFGKGIYIRIPPRPTRKKAFDRFLAKRQRGGIIKKVIKGIMNFIKTGSTKGMKI